VTIHANQQVFHWAPPDSRRKLCLYQSDAAESSRLAPLSTRMSVTAFCSKFADSRLFGQASPRSRLQNLGTASLPNLNRIEAPGFPQKHKLLALCNGEPTIPQLHYYHNDIAVSAQFCFSLGRGFRSTYF